MTKYAALDVSMEQTAICVVDENGEEDRGGEGSDRSGRHRGLAGREGWATCEDRHGNRSIGGLALE